MKKESSIHPYEPFLTFVAVTLFIRILSVIEDFSINVFLKAILCLALVFISINIIPKNKQLISILKKLGDRYKISITALYIGYILLYTIIFYII